MMSDSKSASETPLVGIQHILCVGDSQTRGIYTTPYPEQLGTLLGLPCANAAHEGDSVPMMTAKFPSVMLPALVPRLYQTKAIIWGGTNDVMISAINGWDAAHIWDHVVELVTLFTARDVDVWLMDVVARSNFTAPLRTMADELNALFSSQWERAGASGLVKLSETFTNYNDLTMYYDGIHPTTYGNSLIAAAVAAAIA